MSVAYFDQLRAQLNEEASLVDTISQGSDFIEIGGVRKHVISYLGDFLFAPERARSPVKSLSGGERNRLLLARLFTRPTNVLVLDEPTNDLDIETLELLEELLANYDGTLFLVSHDRAFLDNVVTQVIAFEGDGQLKEYVGGYEDWVRMKDFKNAQDKTASVPAAKAAAKTVAEKTNREQAELQGSARTGRSSGCDQGAGTRAGRGGFDFVRRKNVPRRSQAGAKTADARSAIEAELMALMTRWEELEGR